MTYKISIVSEKNLTKDINKLSPKEIKLIFDKIGSLKFEPWPEHVQVKKLHNYDLADFRLRVGNYRILFNRDLTTKEILIIRIKHRSKLY